MAPPAATQAAAEGCQYIKELERIDHNNMVSSVDKITRLIKDIDLHKDSEIYTSTVETKLAAEVVNLAGYVDHFCHLPNPEKPKTPALFRISFVERHLIREIMYMIGGLDIDVLALRNKIIELAKCFHKEEANTNVQHWIPTTPTEDNIDDIDCDISEAPTIPSARAMSTMEVSDAGSLNNDQDKIVEALSPDEELALELDDAMKDSDSKERGRK